MFRTQHYHHLAEKRRQPGGRVSQTVEPGHEFAWEFGGMPEYSSDASATVMAEVERAVLVSLDKALALAG